LRNGAYAVQRSRCKASVGGCSVGVVALDKQLVLDQIDAALQSAQTVSTTSTHRDFSDAGLEKLAEVRSSCAAAIERFAAPGSTFAEGAKTAIDKEPWAGQSVRTLIGILRALRTAYENDYLTSLVELVHADVFADYLTMASELQSSGYKDAAAVIAGSTLEEHLRKLAIKASVAITDSNGKPAKASRINDHLKGASVYNAMEWRQVQAWLDLRNAAAHGEYEKYEHAQVANMIQGIGDFMVRHPA
jgi:hypothetical protein